MSLDLLHSLASNLWAVFLVVLFFDGSIFVHELGHFLAARRRGVRVERFSIGFGPKIFSWRDKNNVEYCVCWLPLGGYVTLPQLADLRAVEGESEIERDALPPLTYGTKLLVLVAGSTFNVLFAFALACVIWVAGQPTSAELNTTEIGTVVPTLTLPNGSTVPSPASRAGLQPGDVIRAIDGHAVDNWPDLVQTLLTGAEVTSTGQPKAVFTIGRDGHTSKVTVYPRITGEDRVRTVGITPAQDLIIGAVKPGLLGAKIGLRPGDQIVAYDGIPLRSRLGFVDDLEHHTNERVHLDVLRGTQHLSLVVPPRPGRKDLSDLGIQAQPRLMLIHPDPFSQIEDQVVMTFRGLAGLLNPHSNVHMSQFAGPVGIISVFYSSAQSGIRWVILFAILLNVNLAILNLLPIPVLDGGQILFATIDRLRGRALPAEFVMTTQSVFVVLLLSFILYVTYNDVRRIRQEARPPPASSPATAPAKPAPAGP